MTDDYLVRHCAPTLAGIKTANLFTCPFDSREELLRSVRRMNKRLGCKGVRVVPLRFSANRALIYLYRPQKLTADLKQEEASRLLQHCGYPAGSCRQSFPMRSAFSWAILRRMSAVLWNTARTCANAPAAGRSTATKKLRKRPSPGTKNAPVSTAGNGPRAKILNG